MNNSKFFKQATTEQKKVGGKLKKRGETVGLIGAGILVIFYFIFLAKNMGVTKFIPVPQGFLSSDIAFYTTIVSIVVLGSSAYILIFVGQRIHTHGKKIMSVDAYSQTANDPRPPILYLRSFSDDGTFSQTFTFDLPSEDLIISDEQVITKIANYIGPLIAIGRPEEQFPELGASRFYVKENEWQLAVSQKLSIAQYVSLKYNTTNGLLWELQIIINFCHLKRLYFILVKVS